MISVSKKKSGPVSYVVSVSKKFKKVSNVKIGRSGEKIGRQTFLPVDTLPMIDHFQYVKLEVENMKHGTFRLEIG